MTNGLTDLHKLSTAAAVAVAAVVVLHAISRAVLHMYVVMCAVLSTL